ncbi:MAG: pyridoxal phosphate-dependent aminotransferase [Planctomycetota bacterium]
MSDTTSARGAAAGLTLSKRVSALEGSPTLALAAKAKALLAEGRDVVNMAVGEPDFDSPVAAQDAVRAALDAGGIKYTPAAGTLALRETISGWLRAERGVDAYGPDGVVVCHSAKHALSHSLLALVEEGDEVLLLPPVWASYDAMVEIAGARPVHVQPRPGGECRPDLAAIRAAIGPRTRGIMLNTPSNPSGYVWTKDELDELCSIVLEHEGLWLLSDEIYGRLVFEGAAHHSPAAHSAEMAARTLLVDGASKVFAMTGYRIGFVAAPAPVAKKIADLQSQVSGCPNYLSQAAYGACLASEPPEVGAMLDEFDARRRIVIEGLRALGLTCPEPRGAFYAFPDVSRYLDERGAAGFCADLLEQEEVVLVPGDVFGAPDHVRMSYAVSRERLGAALERLGRFLKERGERNG